MKESFEKLVNLTEKLRGPGGCPWDQKQTFETMKDSLLGEAQEVAEAIDNRDMDNLEEELGDLLVNIVLIAQIAKEKNLFDLKSSVIRIHEKMIRRHPHVFGDKKASTPEEAMRLFQEEKMKEKEAKKKSD